MQGNRVVAEGERHTIGDGLTATIARAGAELCSIRDHGVELLWPAGPPWPRHAPVLFPIVGRLAGDTLRHDGAAYPMTQHGFARDRDFRFVERARAGCRLLLQDDARSRAVYPFAFILEIDYRIEGGSLAVRYTLTNPSASPLPASLGAHPAFLWPLPGGPLPGGPPPGMHAIIFEREEPAPIRRLAGGLLRPDPLPTPIRGRRLDLDASLFDEDALILEAPASASLRYGVPGGAGLRLGWTGFRQLGLWSKRDAGFLCIEPWSGLASPQGFDGPFKAKPHLMLIPPGESRQASWTVTPEAIM